MLNWDKLRIFYTVAKIKNLTYAGDELGISQSALSRQIASLEHQAKTQLFHRRPRGLLLTEQGEILYKIVADVFRKLAIAENTLLDFGKKPKGKLRIAVPMALGIIWISHIIKDFKNLYPDLELEIILEDREINVTMREADIALRFYSSKQPNIIQRKLFSINSAIYASNNYLQKYSTPTLLEDLTKHTLIAYGTAHQPFHGVNWLFDNAHKQDVNLNASVTINSLYGILQAIKSGLGIAALPDYMVKGAKNISKILPDIYGKKIDAYMIYADDMRESVRVRAFYQFICEKAIDAKFRKV